MKLVKYGAPHCGMCAAMAENLKKAMLPIEIVDKNCDDEEVMLEAAELGIRNIPVTMLVDEEGKELARWNGIVSADLIKAVINKYQKMEVHKGNYMYIFEYTNGELLELELTEEETKMDSEDILRKHGLKEDQCSWLVTSNKLSIKSLN